MTPTLIISYLPAVVEPVVAALIADGMSRVGVTELSQGGLPIDNPLGPQA